MLQEEAYRLFEYEIEHWQLARDKYADLSKSITKKFDFDDFSIDISCNPARMRSTLADVKQRLEKIRTMPNSSWAGVTDTKDKCFLCSDVRPHKQQYVEVGNFDLLVNPYPIFPVHFTIAHKRHTPQLIIPYFDDFLYFAKNLPDFAIFYNGANCGASAPLHAHFQAAEKKYFNILKDYQTLPDRYFETIDTTKDSTLQTIKNYLRAAFCISTTNAEEAKAIFIKHFEWHIEANMINIICCYEMGRYIIFVFPRKQFRPTQFFEEDETKRLAISPASVEMSGCFVTIFKEHFYRISKEQITDIFRQIS